MPADAAVTPAPLPFRAGQLAALFSLRFRQLAEGAIELPLSLLSLTPAALIFQRHFLSQLSIAFAGH